MSVFRPISALRNVKRSRAFATRRGAAALLLATCCGAGVGLSGCQGLSGFSGASSSRDSAQDALAKALEESRAAREKTASSDMVPPAGAATIAQHLQLGEQALAEHANNPARLAEAKGHFEEVLRADPGHPAAHHRLAVIADLTQDFTQAERHYAQALQRNPSDPQLLHDIGYSYILQDKPDEAIPYLQQCLALSPGFEMASRKLADAYVRTRQYELAQQTLRQIVPEPQVQDELRRLKAAHDPAARPSLLGRVRDNMRDLRPDAPEQSDAAQQLLADLERARIEGERARQLREMQQQQQAAANSGQGLSPWGSRPAAPAIHDSQLAAAIAQIDRQSQPDPRQPLVIGPPGTGGPAGAPGGVQTAWGVAERAPILPAAHQYESGPMAAGQVPVSGMMAQGATGVERMPMSPSGFANGAPGQVGVNGSPAFHYAEVVRGTERGTAAPEQALSGQTPPRDGYWPNSAQFSAAPQFQHGLQQVGPVVPAGGQTPGATVANADGAPFVANQMQPSAAGNPVLRGALVGPGSQQSQAASQAYQSAPAQQPLLHANQGGMHPQAVAAGRDEYEAAAALGMGVGPGQMFPLMQDAAVASPGAGSTWNGTQFPQPGRHLPIDQPIADLSQAFRTPGQPAGATLTPPPNSHGQQMPAPSQSWTNPTQFSSGQQWGQGQAAQQQQQPEQFGTASTFQMQPPVPAMQSPLLNYDQQRAQLDAGTNSLIEQVRGQYAQQMPQSPASGIPVNQPRPAAAQMSSWYTSATGAPMGAPQQGIVTPEPYPSASFPGRSSGAAQAPQVAPLPDVSSGLPPAQYGPDVVVPPAYQSARTSYRPNAAGGADASGVYQGPVIVPGQ